MSTTPPRHAPSLPRWNFPGKLSPPETPGSRRRFPWKSGGGGGQGRLPRPGSDTPSFRALCGAGHAREPEPPGKEETLFAGIGHLTIGSSF